MNQSYEETDYCCSSYNVLVEPYFSLLIIEILDRVMRDNENKSPPEVARHDNEVKEKYVVSSSAEVVNFYVLVD